jgi:hypothetical protein
MGKMSELSMTLDELIDTGQKLAECGEALIRTANEIRAAFSETDPAPAAKAEVQAQPETPAEKTYTKEEVRKILAEKSVAGFREQAKALVKKYGGGSLTDVNPADYPALVKETEALE